MTIVPTPALQVQPYPLPGRSELPENLVDWRVRPERAVLLIHDMQQYFLAAFPHALRGRLIANAALLRRNCAERGVRIGYTAQPGRMSAADRGLLQDFWGAGMTTAEADRAIVAELTPETADWTFTKWRYSAFHRSNLLGRMRAEGRDQLLLCGVYGHVGILATALEAYANDLQVFLVADAVGDFSAEKHRFTLEYTASCCARITTVAEALS